MVTLKRDTRKLLSGKKVVHLRLVENKVINGKNKRIYLENLGVLGQDITISEAKAILHEKYPANQKTIIEKIDLKTLYLRYTEIYKEVLIGEFFFKAKTIHKAQTLGEFEMMVENGSYKLLTYITYTHNMERAVDFMGEVLINEIDIDHTRRYMNYLLREFNLSSNSIRIKFVELRKTLKYAIQKGWLRSLPPMPGMNEINKLGINKHGMVKEANIYSDEELTKLYFFANSDQRFLIDLFMETGMRPEEVDHMYMKGSEDSLVQIDLKEGVIVINSYRANKKGRVIPLSSKLKISIEERIASGKTTDRVCPYPNTIYSRNALQRLAVKAGIKSVDRKCNLKMFRATKNTKMIRNNVEGAIRANFLGNSMEVQTKHYTGSVMEKLREIVDTKPDHTGSVLD